MQVSFIDDSLPGGDITKCRDSKCIDSDVTNSLYMQVPRVDDPSQLLADVTEWLEQYKRDKPKGD